MQYNALLTLGIALLALPACGDDDGGNDCQPRCEARASTCGAPAGFAVPICQDICATATEATVSCLESSSCAELNDAFATGTLCMDTPRRDSGPGGVDGSTGRDVGGGCDLSAAPYCEGNAVVTCERIDGIVAEVLTSCGSDICEAGECEAAACLEAGERGCSGLDFGDGACCGALSCNQQGRDRVCCALDFGCERDEDCCLYQPDFPEASATCVAGECVFDG